MENKVSDEGIKTSLPSSDDANRILSCPQTPGGRKVILQTAFKDHNPRTQSRQQFHEHTFLSMKFLPLRSRNLLGVLAMASFFHLVPRSVG